MAEYRTVTAIATVTQRTFNADGTVSTNTFDVTAEAGKVVTINSYITIEQTEEGAVVTVTDTHGSTTATIYNGKDGADGAPGAKGDQGERGEKGEKGDPGTPGVKGDKGDTGATGAKGDTGEIGPAGEKGEKGDTGATGPQGQKGDKGDTGDTGPKGDKGDKGEKGDTGASGADGKDGKDGINGINGKDGKDGTDGVDGKDGADGFSPIASVSKSGNTTTITITDKNGTTTATVNDGVGDVASVNGKTGAVVLNADDVGALPDDTEIPTVPTNVSAFTNDAGYLTSYTETDPTVPSWAKAQNKPTYTASEVGALPDTTTIPTTTSELTNDSGYVNASEAANAAPVQSVNGQTGTVVLDASDVGALPDTTVIPTKTSDLTNDSDFMSGMTILAYGKST